MRKLFHVMLLAAVCCGCLVSCNEKPKSYRYVKVMPDGKEVVEKIEAENDTVAAKIFLDRMVKTFSQPQEAPAKVIYIISPEGDTLNTNKSLMEAAFQQTAQPQDSKAIPLKPVAEKQPVN